MELQDSVGETCCSTVFVALAVVALSPAVVGGMGWNLAAMEELNFHHVMEVVEMESDYETFPQLVEVSHDFAEEASDDEHAAV